MGEPAPTTPGGVEDLQQLPIFVEAMTPSTAPTVAGTNAPAEDGTIQSVIAEARKELVVIEGARSMLQQHVKDTLQRVQKLQKDYWAAQDETFDEAAGGWEDAEGGDEDRWRRRWQVDFATHQSSKAMACQVEEKRLRAKIDRASQKLKTLDRMYWDCWQSTLYEVKLDGRGQESGATLRARPAGGSTAQVPPALSITIPQPSPQPPVPAEQRQQQPQPQPSVAQKTPPNAKPKDGIRQTALEAAKLEKAMKAPHFQAPYSTSLQKWLLDQNLASPALATLQQILDYEAQYLTQDQQPRRSQRATRTTIQAAREALASRPVRGSPTSVKTPSPTKGTGLGSGKQQKQLLSPKSKPPSKSPAAHKGTRWSSAKRKQTAQALALASNPQPVTNPEPGQLYQIYYHSGPAAENGWYMGTVLPWMSKDWRDELMLDLSMSDVDLTSGNVMPACYEPIFEDGQLAGVAKWAPGFEDGGPRVLDRSFIVLYFEDDPAKLGCLKIDPDRPTELVKFPDVSTLKEPLPIDWVGARFLRAANSIYQDKTAPVRGVQTAERFRRKMSAAAARKHDGLALGRACQLGQPQPAPIGATSATRATSTTSTSTDLLRNDMAKGKDKEQGSTTSSGPTQTETAQPPHLVPPAAPTGKVAEDSGTSISTSASWSKLSLPKDNMEDQRQDSTSPTDPGQTAGPGSPRQHTPRTPTATGPTKPSAASPPSPAPTAGPTALRARAPAPAEPSPPRAAAPFAPPSLPPQKRRPPRAAAHGTGLARRARKKLRMTAPPPDRARPAAPPAGGNGQAAGPDGPGAAAVHGGSGGPPPAATAAAAAAAASAPQRRGGGGQSGVGPPPRQSSSASGDEGGGQHHGRWDPPAPPARPPQQPSRDPFL